MLTVVNNGGGGEILVGIQVTTAPTKTAYKAGESLDVTGMVVSAVYTDGDTTTYVDVTSECTLSPTSGTVLYESTNAISISYTKDSKTYTTSQTITVTRVLTKIAITTQPTVRSYYKGDTLDLSGLVLTAIFNSGATAIITSSATYSPANGSTLNTYGTITVTASYTENGVTKTTNTTVSVTVKTVTWAFGADAEIVNMVEAADAGLISLSDYWAVGDERSITLSAMDATGVGDSHVSQTMKFVLMNAGGKTLVNTTAGGRTTCSFVVGLKNGLGTASVNERGYMNSSNTNVGGWTSSARRTWCNNVFKAAIPSSISAIFKQFKNLTSAGNNQSTINTDNDYFALPSEIEVFGSITYSYAGEGSQFTYYATSANRLKYDGDNSSSAYYWWERSPQSGNTKYFCVVDNGGGASNTDANNAYLVAPFGCI